MKKRFRSIAAWMLAALIFTLSACGSTADKPVEPTPSPTAEPMERTEALTIPESVLSRLKLDVAALSRRLELYNVSENIDGSCTVRMTPEEKDVIRSALRTALDAEMAALSESGTWPFLTKAEISADGTAVTLHTTAASYDPVRDRTVAEAVYLPALLYAAFTAEDAENFTVKITVTDENGKQLDAYTYPEPELTPTPEADPAGTQ